MLHSTCPALAKRVFAQFSEDGQVSRLAENVEQGSFYVLDLLAKSSCALARAGLLHDRDVRRIRSLILEVPDPYLRVHLYSRLAFFYWRENEHGHFSSIVNSNIWPELDRLKEGDAGLLYQAWVSAYGVVWLENRDRARGAIAEYPKGVRQSSVQNLCYSVLYKFPTGNPSTVVANHDRRL